MKLKVYENLGKVAVALFRQAGHEVDTVREEGLSGASDHDVIAACQLERRGLVTLDLDFSNPFQFPPADHHGIMVLRVPAKISPADIVAVCQTLISALQSKDVLGKVWIIERGRLREYRPDDSNSSGDT